MIPGQFVPQDDGVCSSASWRLFFRMAALVAGVEDSPKKAISDLPDQQRTLRFFHRDRSQSNFFFCEENVVTGGLKQGAAIPPPRRRVSGKRR
jgi:hypothetical protein